MNSILQFWKKILIAGDMDMENTPSRQFGYSLTKTVLQIGSLSPNLKVQSQALLVDYLEKVQRAFVDAIAYEGLRSDSIN
jgi:hypothetical protein